METRRLELLPGEDMGTRLGWEPEPVRPAVWLLLRERGAADQKPLMEEEREWCLAALTGWRAPPGSRARPPVTRSPPPP